MTNNIFSSGYTNLINPSDNQRTLRRPDLRNIFSNRLSANPFPGEIDYDDLIIHRSWRSYDEVKPDNVKYFMYELSQRDVGQKLYNPPYYKAIRMLRLTRVPRYLRQASSSSGPNMVFEQMRDVLAALREQGVLFVNMIAKSPQTPLIFAYGVQGIGNTPQEAMRNADEAFAVLEYQIDGTYQQLRHAPITVAEGELLTKNQNDWQHLAMARGRPMPTGGSLGSASLLDGNRTDVESVNNQLESFIRGMSDKSFLLTLITVPLSPAEIASAWRNITQKLTEARSETTGSRTVSAGFSIPMTMGVNQSDAQGSSSTNATSFGTSSSDAQSHSVAQGVTNTLGNSISTTAGHSTSLGDNFSIGQSSSSGVSQSDGVTSTQGSSATNQVGSSSSVAAGSNQAQSWNNSIGQSLNSTVAQTDSWNQSNTNSASQSVSAGNTNGTSASTGNSSQTGSSVSGGIPGVASGGTTDASGLTTGSGVSNQNSTSISQTGGSSAATGIGQSLSNSQSQGLSFGESFGGSAGSSLSATNGVSQSQSLSTSQSVAASHTMGTNQSVSANASQGQSLTTGESISQALGKNQSAAQSLSNTTGDTRQVGSNQGFSDSYAIALTRTVGNSGAMAVAPNFGVAVSRNTFDAAKHYIGDLLEAQMRRYDEGIKSGGFLYQMFLLCPDRETVLGGAGLLKSAFWGAGVSGDPLPQPFHTIVDFDDSERRRLITHASALTSYRRREPTIELVEPFFYSSYVTPGEASAFVHPPTVEGPGLMAVVDSMPVTRMPVDRQDKEINIGHIVNGERGIVSNIRFGVDTSELTHTLIAGVTGSGKTTTLMKMLSEVVNVERTIIEPATPDRPFPIQKKVYASVLGLDWMKNMRDLASIPELTASGRFKFYSLLKPELGKFSWNPLEIPADGMTAAEWLNAQADNFTASFNLGEFGRSLISELLTELYSINRLHDHDLRSEVSDLTTGQIFRKAVVLKAIPKEQIPAQYIQIDPSGNEYVNVFTFPSLSSCVSMADLATLVAERIEKMADPNNKKLFGSEMSNRLQSLWRRMQYFAPGGQYSDMLGSNKDLVNKTTLNVSDLINPDRGFVTILETDGLDLEARRLVLGSLMLAIYRYGLYHGNGVFDHNGKGPGCFIVMEESHELFGETGRNEDAFSSATRTHLYESMFRRVRALGLKLVAVAQQPSALPEAVTANISTVFIHQVSDDNDRKKAFSLLNWLAQIGQQQREWRYLGEMAVGFAMVRLGAKEDYTEASPIQIRTDPPLLSEIDDRTLKSLL